ncbi:MAG: OmpH family outer membrane protein [Candidatus Eremiobacteraeota bacterium]|nr:OmpH family outer membrane protein [Candidatus Eremiobacteraeota bacterium]
MQTANRHRWLGRSCAAALALFIGLAASPQVLGTDISDIGFVDQAAIGSLKPFQEAQAQFAAYRDQISRQFQAAIKGKSRAQQQKIYADFGQRSVAKQHDVFGPLLARTQIAIASVAANKNLSVVVDKQIIIVGGQDITKDVINMLNQPGQLVPPVNTPPPSEVGFVDQQQINDLAKVKKANQDFLAARQNLQGQLNGQLAGKNADQQKQVVASFNQQLGDQQKKIIQPIIDATQKAISATAKSKNLLLVIDATNRVYGGTDVTSDVVKALQ